MKIMDAHQAVAWVDAIAAAHRTAGTVLSAAIDRHAATKMFSGRGFLGISVGVFVAGTLTVTLTECATSGGAYTAVPATAYTAPSAKAAIGNFTVPVDFDQTKQFLKVSAVVSGGGDIDYGVSLVAPASERTPITNPAA